MGKCGHVGRKIAATLASTGTPAFFVHPAEASHGDLGMITADDVVLAISNSGESDEIAAILPLDQAPRRDADRDDRARAIRRWRAKPTCTSTRASRRKPARSTSRPPRAPRRTLALGDALAVALLDARGFRERGLRALHPGGALGRRLLMHVRDLMRSGDAVPRSRARRRRCCPTALRRDDAQGPRHDRAWSTRATGCSGIFTDGDLRRMLEKRDSLTGRRRVGDVMHRGTRARSPPTRSRPRRRRSWKRASIERTLVVLTPRRQLVGALTFHDLLAPRSSERGRSRGRARAARCALAIFDVDGVLTDGTPVLRRARRGDQGLQHPRRPRAEAAAEGGHRDRDHLGPQVGRGRDSARASSASTT